MDFETISAAEFGQSLAGVGINLLSRDVRGLAGFLRSVFEADIHRLSDDFAIVTFNGSIIQLHRDATYAGHPLVDYLPENPPRGRGAQIYMFGADPDEVANRADATLAMVIEAPKDKPHGLRECTVLSPEGYAFTAAVARAD